MSSVDHQQGICPSLPKNFAWSYIQQSKHRNFVSSPGDHSTTTYSMLEILFYAQQKPSCSC